jgi:hypothetical protein
VVRRRRAPSRASGPVRSPAGIRRSAASGRGLVLPSFPPTPPQRQPQSQPQPRQNGTAAAAVAGAGAATGAAAGAGTAAEAAAGTAAGTQPEPQPEPQSRSRGASAVRLSHRGHWLTATTSSRQPGARSCEHDGHPRRGDPRCPPRCPPGPRVTRPARRRAASTWPARGREGRVPGRPSSGRGGPRRRPGGGRA